ncbi:hypothetical protein T12_1018 [Trichinella patagoniensis]|uniref:Uncharacterized protein n=1 Tax=Trichinella patagoniensis TaxID=990121 RepID=A0A0V0Z2E7_9BILA|nr:hypothetical protein T12_1018 [Trichinella patagoniensis]
MAFNQTTFSALTRTLETVCGVDVCHCYGINAVTPNPLECADVFQCCPDEI